MPYYAFTVQVPELPDVVTKRLLAVIKSHNTKGPEPFAGTLHAFCRGAAVIRAEIQPAPAGSIVKIRMRLHLFMAMLLLVVLPLIWVKNDPIAWQLVMTLIWLWVCLGGFVPEVPKAKRILLTAIHGNWRDVVHGGDQTSSSVRSAPAELAPASNDRSTGEARGWPTRFGRWLEAHGMPSYTFTFQAACDPDAARERIATLISRLSNKAANIRPIVQPIEAGSIVRIQMYLSLSVTLASVAYLLLVWLMMRWTSTPVSPTLWFFSLYFLSVWLLSFVFDVSRAKRSLLAAFHEATPITVAPHG